MARIANSPELRPPTAADVGRPVSRTALIGAFGAVYLFWGSTYLASKFAMASFPPYLLGGIRFVAAAVAMAGVLLATGKLRPADFGRLRWWRNCGGAGLLFFAAANGILTMSIQRIPSGIAALVVALTSVWIVLLDRLILREGAPSWTISVGLVLGVAGVTVLGGPSWSGPGGEVDTLGVLLAASSTIAWALGTMVSKHAERPPSVWAASVMQMFTGGVAMFLISAIFERAHWPEAAAITPGAMGSVLYLVIFGSLIGFSAYVWLLDNANAAAVATYAYINPLVALGLGWALANEAIPSRTAFAAPLILGSVALIQFVRPPAKGDPPVDQE